MLETHLATEDLVSKSKLFMDVQISKQPMYWNGIKVLSLSWGIEIGYKYGNLAYSNGVCDSFFANEMIGM